MKFPCFTARVKLRFRLGYDGRLNIFVKMYYQNLIRTEARLWIRFLIFIVRLRQSAEDIGTNANLLDESPKVLRGL